MWGKESTLRIWEACSQALRVVKDDTTASTFPLPALTKIFVNIPEEEVSSGVACWNLIKEHYLSVMNKASARLIDIHFQTQVSLFVTSYSSFSLNSVERRNPKLPRRNQKARKREKSTMTQKRKRNRRKETLPRKGEKVTKTKKILTSKKHRQKVRLDLSALCW